jgi:thiosulfate/3-mercaptopyruvate sulfurtransferase
MGNLEGAAVEIKDTQWLEENRTKVQIIDCQPEVYDYLHSHIEGSVYLSDKLWRTWHDYIPTRYACPEAIGCMLKRAGINGAETVAVYSGSGGYSRSGDGLEAAMFAYSLARHGVRDIVYINGGFDKWKQEGRAVTKEFPFVEEKELSIKIKPRTELFLTYNQFLEVKNLKDTFVVDVRPPAVYEHSSLWTHPGHIPGAHNIPWHNFMDSQNHYLLKPVEQIKEIVLSAGARPQNLIAIYCGTGREAAMSFLTFKWLLGFPNVKLFEGSFTEWCAMKQETETGK